MIMGNANVQFIYVDCFIKSVNVLHAYLKLASVIYVSNNETKPCGRPRLLAFWMKLYILT